MNWLPCGDDFKNIDGTFSQISPKLASKHLREADGVVAACQVGVAGDDIAGLPHLVVGVAKDAGESLLKLRTNHEFDINK